MTQTMLEKMARAMHAEFDRQAEARLTYASGYGQADDNRTILDGAFDLEAVARAALQALREPTEEIRKALGYEFANTFTDPLDVISVEEAEIFQFDPATTEDLWLRPVAELMVEDAVTVFQAAIDAALQEKPEQG